VIAASRATRALVFALVAVGVIGASAGAAGAGAPASRDVGRVLVISLPATSWADIKAGDDPNLRQLLADSAIANMVTRAAGRKSSIQGGYTALGAGGRASAASPLAAQAFEVTEPYGASTAGAVYRQRTGIDATSGIVHLGIDDLITENANGLYDPQIGALGDTLEAAHVPRAVIANGDGAQPIVDDPLPEFQRSAVNALMTHDGRVPNGVVGDELLMPDKRAPFGVRMDNDVAYHAFQRAWGDGGVVLVEGSDLLRADLYSDFLTADELKVQKQAALRRTDELVGRMLADVDPTRDAVFVVSPASPRRGPGLAVAGIRAPGVQPELLKSGTSRRDGFVYVVDVAPTILEMLGLQVPATMEGETMVVVGGVAHGDRIDTLIHANEDAVFRDSKVATANNIVIVLSVLLALAAFLVVSRAPRRAGLVRFFALTVLGFLFATYAAAPLHFGRSGSAGAYFGFLVVFALAFAAACRLLSGRRRYLPLGLALAATVVLHVGDLLAGARLELNTVFGYSATVGIRVSGQGNLTFSQLTAAVLLLGGLAVWRRPGRRTVWAVIAMLAVTLLVMAAPPWGGDFGSAIAGAPAFGLFAWLLLGRRIRVRTVAILGVVLVVSGLLVGFADLMRPKEQRTHVGRFFDKVAHDGLGGFLLTLRRKAGENLDSFTGTKLLWIIPVVALLVWFLWRSPHGRIRELYDDVPVVRQTMLALAVVAFLGYALNDSGVAIPALMAVVFECAVVYVALVADRKPVAEPPPSAPVDGDADPVYARSPELV
jgi:hypothetical protein